MVTFRSGFVDASGAGVDELLEEAWGLRERQVSQTSLTLLEWCAHVPAGPGRPLDLERFPYQVEWYAEDAVWQRLIVTMKSTQVGASEHDVRWALQGADVHGHATMYLMPTATDAEAFHDRRVHEMFLNSPYLRGRQPFGGVDTKAQKQIGNGWLYLRGTQSVSALESTPIDRLVLDELDKLNPEAVPVAMRRMSGVDSARLSRRLSTPTYSQVGISAEFEASDMRRWLVKCPKGCGDQPIEFYANVERWLEPGEEPYVGCHRCGAPLNVLEGRWVAEHPDRDVRGYHATQLIVHGCDLRAIVKASQSRDPNEIQSFHNRDLGVPFDPKEGRLSEADLLAAQKAGGFYRMPPEYLGVGLVTAGIDVASVRALNVRVSLWDADGKKIALFLGESTFDDLPGILERYGVQCAVFDHEPEQTKVIELRPRFPGVIWLAHYADKLKGTPWRYDEAELTVTAQRTWILDRALTGIRDWRNVPPGDWPADYVQQMRNVRRVVVETTKGEKVARYEKVGPSDYAHAEAYDELAWLVHTTRRAVAVAGMPQQASAIDMAGTDRVDLNDPAASWRPQDGLRDDGWDDVDAPPDQL